jgi:hypothetical protein
MSGKTHFAPKYKVAQGLRILSTLSLQGDSTSIGSKQWALDSGQLMVGSKHWAVACEQWVVGSRQ